MFEVNTMYTGGSVTEFAEPWESMVKPMLSEFGAQSPTAWEALTGTFAGATVISTRWDSLQAIGTWLSEMPSKLAATTALLDVAASSTLAVRVVGKDVLEHGNPDGSYLSASRYSFTGPPTGFDHAAQLSVGAGANGVRIYSLLAASEWSGQVIGSMFYDDLDGMDSVLDTLTSDAQFVANAKAAGGKLESRTIFRRL